MSALFNSGVTIDILVLDRDVEYFLPFNHGKPAQEGFINAAKSLLASKKLCDRTITTAIEQYAFFCDKVLREGYQFHVERQRHKTQPEREAAVFDILKEDLPKVRNMIHHYAALNTAAVQALKTIKTDYGARYAAEAVHRAFRYLREIQTLFYEGTQPYLENLLEGKTIRLKKEDFLL